MARPLVIVGAGSAGAVIAARASEDRALETVLIESGPDYPDGRLPQDLRNGRRNAVESHDWGYRYRANAKVERAIFPRGRVVGGSSAVNTCIALRGQPYDYDEWAERVGAHWSWEACLPYFKRLENDLDRAGPYHGKDGPIPIRRHTSAELMPIQTAFVDACSALGHPRCDDHNDPTTTGFGPHCMNKVDGVRINVATAYLDSSVRQRDNLRIDANTAVQRVLFEGRRVRGLELCHHGQISELECDRVVLCAGAIATPGILLRSGIGPRAQVQALGLSSVVDAPVGEHLLDHPGAGLVLVPKDGTGKPDAPMIQTVLRYTSSGSAYPNDMQLQPLSFVQLPMIPLLFALTVMVGKTRGTGKLRYESAAPDARPSIEPARGEHEEDRRKLIEGLRLAVEVAQTTHVSRLATIAWPSEQLLDRSIADSDWLLTGTGSGYHPCGTAPMGTAGDGRSVVDGHGRVHGVEGLFVADASIMPTIPSSNINLPTIMIGERFGEWFRDGML